MCLPLIRQYHTQYTRGRCIACCVCVFPHCIALCLCVGGCVNVMLACHMICEFLYTCVYRSSDNITAVHAWQMCCVLRVRVPALYRVVSILVKAGIKKCK